MAVVDHLGSIQFDPLDVAGRNHDLVLQARIGGYRRELADELLYGRRTLFETYNKSLNLLPTRELPFYRLTWQKALEGRAGTLVAEQAALAEKILGEIRDQGPKCSLDFEREAAIAWWWGPTTAVRAVLEALCVSGVVSLSRREGNRRYYDLTERLYPAQLLAEQVTERAQVAHKLLSRHRAHGLLGSSGSGELWSGTGMAPLRAELRAEMVESGRLVPMTVEGVRGQRFVLADELPTLDRAEREAEAGQQLGSVSFIAPLDPLMWDRTLLGPLYDFDYIWEVYTPAAKRRWGYYVLPVFFGDRFVGRIEPRLDRRSGRARILGLDFEPGFDPIAEPGFVEAFGDSLNAYLAFGGATALVRSEAIAAAPHRALFRELSSRVPIKSAGGVRSGRSNGSARPGTSGRGKAGRAAILGPGDPRLAATP